MPSRWRLGCVVFMPMAHFIPLISAEFDDWEIYKLVRARAMGKKTKTSSEFGVT